MKVSRTTFDFSKRNKIAGVILLFIFCLVYSLVFDKKLDLNGDNFAYLNYASSIVQGHGYASPYTPNYAATNFYPPGYSAILALFMAIFGENIVLFKLLNGAFYLAGLGLLYVLIQAIVKESSFEKKENGLFPSIFAFSVVLFLCFNAELLRFSTIIMSEIPYLFFSLLAFYFLFKDDSKNPLTSGWFYGIILASSAAYYIRGVGLTLAAGIGLYFLFSKKWKHLGAYVAGWAILWLPWKLRDMSYGLKGRYFDTITIANVWRPEEGSIDTVGGFLHKFGVNFYDTVIKGFTDVTFPFIHMEQWSVALSWLFGIIVLALTFYGAWKAGKYRWLFVGYLLANIAIFLLWHGGNGARYVRPLAPFILFCLLNGLYCLLAFTKSNIRKGIVPALCLIGIFCSFQGVSECQQQAKEKYHPAYKNYFSIAETLKKNGIKETMVICRKPDMFYYFSGCYVSSYLFSTDDKKILADMVKKKTQFVVLEQLGYSSTGLYLYPAITKNQELFRPVMHLQNPDTYLLAFDLEKAEQLLNEVH